MTEPGAGIMLLTWAATYLVHSTALFALAWMLCGLRGRLVGPVVHATLWRTALVGALATSLWPTLTSFTPITGALAVDLASGNATAAPPLATGAAADTVFVGAAAWAWGLATLLMIARLGARRVRLARLLRDRRIVAEGPLRRRLDALCASAGVRKRVRLSASSRIATPLALGSSEVCVPERSRRELSPDEQNAMLAHELAHLLRKDAAWLWTAKLIETIFWFQPLHRLAARRMQESAEFVADAWAVEQTGSHRGLASCLTTVATWLQDMPSPQLAVTLGDRSSPLMKRVRTLLEKEHRPIASRRSRLGLVVSVLAATVLFVPAVSAGARAGQQDHDRQERVDVERIRAMAEARLEAQHLLGHAATTDYDDEIRVVVDQRVTQIVDQRVRRIVRQEIPHYQSRDVRNTIRHIARTVPREFFRNLGRSIRTITRSFHDFD